MQQQQAGAAGRRALVPAGPGRHVDNTPSKGRAPKAQRTGGDVMLQGAQHGEGLQTFFEVVNCDAIGNHAV